MNNNKFKFDSTNVAEAEYFPKKGKLQVTFNNGAVYNYVEIDQKMWEAFKSTTSAGWFVNHILTKFPYVRVK